MDEKLLGGVLCAIAGVVATKLTQIFLAKRNGGNGNGANSRNLRSARELADLASSAEDLLRRVSDIENTLVRINRDRQRGHGRGGD